MNTLIIGGFLGSGKTTVINRLIRSMTGEGLRVAIVENETGEVSVDRSVLQGGYAGVTSLSGGCVCCELFGNLLAAIDDIRSRIDPDWLIIETTGLAAPDSIRRNLELYGSKELRFHLIAVADCERFDMLWDVITPLLTAQLSAADLVLLSKSDLRVPSEKLQSILTEHAPGTPILDTSAAELWNAVSGLLKERAPHTGSR